MAFDQTKVQFGSFSVDDLNLTNNTAIIDFAEINDIAEYTKIYVDAYNAQMTEEMSLFVEPVNDRVITIDGAGIIDPQEVDEWGVVDAQKVTNIDILGMPIRRRDTASQWTMDWYENASVAEFVKSLDAIVAGDKRQVTRDIKAAMFTAVNSTYYDRFYDKQPLPVKALANADGFPIPPSPTGVFFNANTHTHYMGTAGSQLAPGDLDALLGNVTEHFDSGDYMFLMSRNTESVLSGNQATFPQYRVDLYDGNVAATNVVNTGVELVPGRTNNRRTGTYRDAVVWVKPWMPDNAIICLKSDTEKPIGRRIRRSAANAANPYTGGGDLRPVYEASNMILHCKVWRREHGFSVKNRVAGAVLSIGNSVYNMPSIV